MKCDESATKSGRKESEVHLNVEILLNHIYTWLAHQCYQMAEPSHCIYQEAAYLLLCEMNSATLWLVTKPTALSVPPAL